MDSVGGDRGYGSACGTVLLVDNAVDVVAISREMRMRPRSDGDADPGRNALTWIRGYAGPVATEWVDLAQPETRGSDVARALQGILRGTLTRFSSVPKDIAPRCLARDLRSVVLQKRLPREQLP